MKRKLSTRYRFRNGSGAFLCLVVMEADRCVLGFHSDPRAALSVARVDAASHVREIAALAGSPVIVDPYTAIEKK